MTMKLTFFALMIFFAFSTEKRQSCCCGCFKRKPKICPKDAQKEFPDQEELQNICLKKKERTPDQTELPEWIHLLFNKKERKERSALEKLRDQEELENIFPNEGSVQVFRGMQTNEITWDDPEDLLSITTRIQFEFCLVETGEKQSNCLFDCISNWFDDVRRGAKPLGKEVCILLSEKVDVGRRGNHNETPLHVAAFFDAEKAVAILVERNASLEAVDTYGSTALHIAAYFKSDKAGKMLVEKQANVDAPNNFGATPLMFAAKNGSEAIMNLLLNRGAKRHIQNYFGETARISTVEIAFSDDEKVNDKNEQN